MLHRIRSRLKADGPDISGWRKVEEMADKLENLIEQYPDNIQLVYTGTDRAFFVGE